MIDRAKTRDIFQFNWISFSHLIYILDTKSFYNRCCFFHANGELTDGLNGYRIDSVLWLEFNEKESTITTNSIKANELWIKLHFPQIHFWLEDVVISYFSIRFLILS